MANAKPKMINAADRTYALALVELADEAGQLDAVAQQVSELAELLEGQPQLAQLLSNRMLSGDQRDALLKSIFEGRIHDLLYRFIQVVGSKGRLSELPGILHACGSLIDERRGIVEVDVYVAQPMDDYTARCVGDGIGRSLKREIRIRQHLDPSLIGGLKVRIGDTLLDGSVAAQLRQIEQELIAAGRRQSRAAVQQQ